MKAPLPEDEAVRQRVLDNLHLLDTSADPVLDGLVRSAAAIIGSPTSVVSFVDRGRQWFKARVGTDVSETSRDIAFCAHAILQHGVFEVSDASADLRFANNPLVTGEPRIRFYAGAPIQVSGQNVGTLCVFGPRPRVLTEGERALLSDLARAVEHWIEGEQRERALHAAERYNRELFEHVGHAVILCDNAHALLDANSAAVELFGYPRGTLLQLSLFELLGKREQNWIRTRDVAAFAAFRRHRAEWVWTARDGRQIESEIQARRIDDGRYMVSIADVTERNRRDVQLRQLALAVEQSTESIICTDLGSHILYANPATTEMSGYAQSELIGSNARIFGSGRTPRSTFDYLYGCLKAGRSWNGLLYNRHKDGSEFINSATVSPLRAADGTISQYVAVMKDVTEERRMAAEIAETHDRLEVLVEKRTEELAHALRAAEAATAAKSAFLATMSHEIRTPMNGVVGLLDLLLQTPLNPQQRDFAETMGESASALLGIIDDILDFSKIEAGRLTIEREVVELAALIENVCFALKPIARAHNVVLHLFVDPSLPECVLGDAVRIRQILNNLIGNAIKFSAGLERRGRVVVRALPSDDDRLLLTITDNGVGIAAEAVDRIFRPFEQAENSTTRAFGGTGLGLSICQRLCDLLSGTIDVESQVNRGSVFKVSLPIEMVIAPRGPRRSRMVAGIQCEIVSGDDEVASDWRVYLEAGGARVMTFATCDALRLAMAGDPVFTRIVVVDARTDERAHHQIDDLRKTVFLNVVVIGSGQDREPHLLESGLVLLANRLVFRESLLKAVAMAAGFDTTTVAELGRVVVRPIEEPPSYFDEERAGRLILVAEDNPINQKVIRHQLALLGFAAAIFRNGTEALEAWRTGRFGLLLTDLNMPLMDGFALAEQIRAAEQPSTRIPIVALTANALRGEEARCLAAGMNECLTKPVQLEALSEMLTRYLPIVASAGRTTPTSDGEASASPVVLDSAVLERLIGADPSTIGEFLVEFRATMEAAAAEIDQALDNGDIAIIGEVAHRLKSSSRAVGAQVLGQRCEALETATLKGEATLIEVSVKLFRQAVTAVAAELLTATTTAPETLRPHQATDIVQGAAVIILDDELADAERLAAQLHGLGFDAAQIWTEGGATLEWLRQRDTSALLLLLDLQMPGMDGIDFMRRLAEQGYDGKVAIVSAANPRVLETAVKLGEAQKLSMLGQFRKPLTDRRLEDLLQLWRGAERKALRGTLRTYAANEVLRGIIDKQMVLHYQPKVSMRDGTVKGLEALVRWQHPTEGLVSPASFVGVVETRGGIDMLTGAVVSLAMAQARAWNDAGTPHCIAINVSMANLLRIDFPELLIAEAALHGLPLSDIRLEVTESRLMSDLRSQVGSLTRLKLNGIALSIDDFGTGHSSLAQLRDIPFDELKIDQSFVHGSAEDTTRRAIFTASLGMAHDLGMIAVAEGVEDRADWDFVRSSGVDLAQGYYIARPMPATELPAWTAAWVERVKDLL